MARTPKTKPKVRKVHTPGSFPQKVSPGRGRPRKELTSKPGWSRKGNYRTKYSRETLEKAIQALKDKEMSLRETSRHFGVPFTTLRDRMAEKSSEAVGHPTELSKEEEDILEERIILMGTWGFPLNRSDLAHLIKAHLDGLGRETR